MDTIEGHKLNSVYGRFARVMFPVTGDIMCPSTTAQKIQSYLDLVMIFIFVLFFLSIRTYITLAYIARIGGIIPLARKYISQARMLSGEIYDQPDAESGMLLLLL